MRGRPVALLIAAVAIATLTASVSEIAQGNHGPDLSISDADLSFSRLDPVGGEPFAIFARVRNIGHADGGATVRFYLEGVDTNVSYLGERVVATVPAGESSTVSLNLTLPTGTHTISARILSVIPWDADVNNHIAYATIVVFPSIGGGTFSSPALLLEGTTATVTSGVAEVISLNVTARGGKALGASLEVLDASGVTALPAGPPIDVEVNTTVQLDLRVLAPDLVAGTNRTERRLLVHAIAANANGNTVEVDLAVVAPPIRPPRDPDPWVPVAVVVSLGLASAFAAVLSVETWRLRVLLLLLPLYTRLRKEEVLDQYTRGKLHGYILANPGDYFTSISRALGIPAGTLAYHIGVLEREGQVVSRQNGAHRRFYPMGFRVDDGGGGELSAVQRTVWKTIADTPGIKQKDIASLIGVSAPTINYHVRRLIDLGFVRGVRRGMAVRYFSTRDAPEGSAIGEQPERMAP